VSITTKKLDCNRYTEAIEIEVGKIHRYLDLSFN
jgi:hypothetical protein